MGAGWPAGAATVPAGASGRLHVVVVTSARIPRFPLIDLKLLGKAGSVRSLDVAAPPNLAATKLEVVGTAQQNAGCKLLNRQMANPVFQCKLKRCKLPNNVQGNECAWEHTGYDMVGNQVGHTDCIGFI